VPPEAERDVLVDPAVDVEPIRIVLPITSPMPLALARDEYSAASRSTVITSSKRVAM